MWNLISPMYEIHEYLTHPTIEFVEINSILITNSLIISSSISVHTYFYLPFWEVPFWICMYFFFFWNYDKETELMPRHTLHKHIACAQNKNIACAHLLRAKQNYCWESSPARSVILCKTQPDVCCPH